MSTPNFVPDNKMFLLEKKKENIKILNNNKDKNKTNRVCEKKNRKICKKKKMIKWFNWELRKIINKIIIINFFRVLVAQFWLKCF